MPWIDCRTERHFLREGDGGPSVQGRRGEGRLLLVILCILLRTSDLGLAADAAIQLKELPGVVGHLGDITGQGRGDAAGTQPVEEKVAKQNVNMVRLVANAKNAAQPPQTRSATPIDVVPTSPGTAGRGPRPWTADVPSGADAAAGGRGWRAARRHTGADCARWPSRGRRVLCGGRARKTGGSEGSDADGEDRDDCRRQREREIGRERGEGGESKQVKPDASPPHEPQGDRVEQCRVGDGQWRGEEEEREEDDGQEEREEDDGEEDGQEGRCQEGRREEGREEDDKEEGRCRGSGRCWQGDGGGQGCRSYPGRRTRPSCAPQRCRAPPEARGRACRARGKHAVVSAAYTTS